MKRYFSIVCVACVFVSLCAGCSSEDKSVDWDEMGHVNYAPPEPTDDFSKYDVEPRISVEDLDLPEMNAATDVARIEAEMDATCIIKGNISFETGERIYHVPGQEYYEATRINLAQGEMWFCSEEEAIAAGWRKAWE